ncbi:MAG TPA: DEAD/DEAH box helicase family protein [Candidatus Sulfotelmatobacter sp.]|nr:DEAD/DEAH box helicase family protein [Candidatus Sulfotelmatobacter sp.]
MSEPSTIYDYMRAHASVLGERILPQHPALHQVGDPVSPGIGGLLRRPFPAQAIAIMGLAKRWQQARTGMVVAECGTGKTLISLGAVHVHSKGEQFTTLAMVPPHLVEKWAREAFRTLPGVRVFLIDDLRNGGDESKSHGVNEARLRHGRIERDGLHTTLSDLRLRKEIVQFPETLAVTVRSPFTVHRRSRANKARLLLAPRLPRTTLGPVPELCRQFRHGQTSHRG